MLGSLRLLSALAVVVVLSPAAAAPMVMVDILPVASLEAGGKTVVVGVRVSCPPRPSDGIQENRLEVRQMRRGMQMIAVGAADLICDGRPRSYEVMAHVEEVTHTFRRGPAVANMFVVVCNASGAYCFSDDATEDIVIVGMR